MHATGTAGRPRPVVDWMQAEGCGARALATCRDHPERLSARIPCTRSERLATDRTRAIAITAAACAAPRPHSSGLSPQPTLWSGSQPVTRDTPSDGCIGSSRSRALRVARTLQRSMRWQAREAAYRSPLSPMTPVLSARTVLVPVSLRKTLSCSLTHAVSDQNVCCHTRQTSVGKACRRGVRRRTSSCPRTLSEAQLRRAASAASTRGDPASWWAHRAVSQADGLVQLVCCAVRAARAAAMVAHLLLCRASAASALHGAAAGRAHTGAAVDVLGAALPCSAGLWRHQHHHLQSSLQTRTRELRCHVADRYSRYTAAGWAVHTVPSHATASSGHGARVLDPAACSDALCGTCERSRDSAAKTAGSI